jgi:hypothetical protein
MGICVAIWLAAGCLAAQERATITGQVTDAAGKPVEHATVLVYEAGVKKGYSIFCPTCYTDCGATGIAGPMRLIRKTKYEAGKPKQANA